MYTDLLLVLVIILDVLEWPLAHGHEDQQRRLFPVVIIVIIIH